MSGWIKFHRKAWNSWVGRDATTIGVWVWLLSHASANDFPSKGVKRGQLRTTLREMSKSLDVSKSTIHRILNQCVKDGAIIWEKAKNQHLGQHTPKTQQQPGQHLGQRSSLITICNYEKYQGTDNGGWDSNRDSTWDSNPEKWDSAQRYSLPSKKISKNPPYPPTGGSAFVANAQEKKIRPPEDPAKPWINTRNDRTYEEVEAAINSLDLATFQREFRYLDVESVFVAFCDYWLSSSQGQKRDPVWKRRTHWDRTFRRWCTKENDKLPKRGQAGERL